MNTTPTCNQQATVSGTSDQQRVAEESATYARLCNQFRFAISQEQMDIAGVTCSCCRK